VLRLLSSKMDPGIEAGKKAAAAAAVDDYVQVSISYKICLLILSVVEDMCVQCALCSTSCMCIQCIAPMSIQFQFQFILINTHWVVIQIQIYIPYYYRAEQ
jgi:hypothetical protein